MEHDRINAWVRAHKRSIARDMVAPYKSQEYPVAFFMAGLPGAGKTELASTISTEIIGKMLLIDMDNLATLIEGYTPERADLYRKGASDILGNVFYRAKHARINFTMDGAFSGARAVSNVQQCLDAGYLVIVYYVHQHPTIAWKFTRSREEVEKRGIKRDGFIQSYGRIRDNLDTLMNIGSSDIYVYGVIKDENNDIAELVPNMKRQDIEQHNFFCYNEEELNKLL